MPDLSDVVSRLVPGAEHLSLPFVLLLLVHVPLGLMCVMTGAAAALSRKRPGRHPGFGTVYYWGLAVVFVTASGMAALRWTEDRHLFVLGAISFALATTGYLARRVRWKGWTSFHVLGMSLSFIVLLTAFYVDNGPHLPLWDRLPGVAYWTLPAIVGLPLVIRAERRHAHLAGDARAVLQRLVGRSRTRTHDVRSDLL
jgi:hypothetical protein